MRPVSDDNHSGKFTLTQLGVSRRLSTQLLLLLALAACASREAQLVLNSDLIRGRFGSYGVEVLHASERQRITNLYSDEQGQKVMRTFAVVDFAEPVPPALAEFHARIVAGESIGEVFRSANWAIDKHHIFIGELNIDTSHAVIGQSMHIELPQWLAAHRYIFVVSKDARQLKYATITEVHHPDFLAPDDLTRLYGEMLFDDSGRTLLDEFVTLPAGF